jgi:uncharacterized protein (DUF3084 family)
MAAILAQIPVKVGLMAAILAQIPVKVGKYGKCQSCDLGGQNQYIKIMYVGADDAVIAELRCNNCNKCQENPLVSEIAHMYTAYINMEKSHNQLLANVNGNQLTINNLNNMCIVYNQHIDKITYDYTRLLEAYNVGKQINTDINTKYNALEENYKKAQNGINEMKEELVTLQTSSLVVIERLKSERDDNMRINTDDSRLKSTISELESTISKLECTNTELECTNKELECTNKELECTNKELKSTNKELECTNKELECTNKELKSTNKELESTNKELKSQIAMLTKQNKSLEQQNKDLKSQNVILKKKDNGDLHKKIVQTYEEELTGMRKKLMDMINENTKLKLIHKERCFEIIKTHESVCKAHCDRIQKAADAKYFAKELEISKKYEEMLKEYDVDETYKLAVKSRYKSKLLLLTYFNEKNPDFGKIQPYTFDIIKTHDPHNIMTLASNTAAAGC